MPEPIPLVDTLPGVLACPGCAEALPAGTNFCPRCGHDLRGTAGTGDTYRGFAPGKVIDGRYRLLERLGEGGMGTVFKVEHVRMGKVLALKVLRSDLALQPQVLQRFRDEALIVSRLSHPNTIAVFDFGEAEGGALFIAMEYVQGKDLSRVLQAEGRLTERRAVEICIQVLRSLAEAHEAGIVHRDIKPGNVMVMRTRGDDDWVKVVDFGIAKLAPGQGAPSSHITGVAEFVGTPAYCSPEQIRGETLDARSDLYSLGAMLFELVSGRGPYDAPTPMGVVAKHLSEPIPSAREAAPEVSPALDAVIRKALAKAPAERFQSADAMRAALEQVLGGKVKTYSGQEVIVTGGFSIASREDWDAFERSLARVSHLRVWLGAALMIGLIAGAVFWGYRRITRAPVLHPVRVERELNDEPQQANLIALDRPVTASMGPSHTTGKSDLDTFMVDVPSAGQLWVSVSGVPDLNLVLEVFDASRQAKHEEDAFTHVTVDDGTLGQGELLAHYPAHPGRYYVRVSERPAYDEPDLQRPPRERENAPYHLTVHEVAASALDELEPNDVASIAQALGFDAPVLGHAGAALPAHAIEGGLALNAFDYFQAAAPGDATVRAFVVQPPDRALGLWDGKELEDWRAASSSYQARKLELSARAKGSEEAARELRRLSPVFLPAPARANAAGILVKRLAAHAGKVVVLVAPLGGALPKVDDAPYGIALAHAGPGGLEAVCALAQVLVAANREPAARALLQSAVAELPGSPDLAQARAQLAAIK